MGSKMYKITVYMARTYDTAPAFAAPHSTWAHSAAADAFLSSPLFAASYA